MSTSNESVRKLTKVSVALRKPLAKAGNGARQGKMRIIVYFKKRGKKREMAACNSSYEVEYHRQKWLKV